LIFFGTFFPKYGIIFDSSTTFPPNITPKNGMEWYHLKSHLYFLIKINPLPQNKKVHSLNHFVP
jgi:hypothetical protein